MQQAVQDVVAGVDGQVAVAQGAANRAEAARDAATDAATTVSTMADGKWYYKTEAALLASPDRECGSKGTRYEKGLVLVNN